jgi:hypothetical protein
VARGRLGADARRRGLLHLRGCASTAQRARRPELPEPELRGFTSDIASVGGALALLFEPFKIDTLMNI